MCMLKEISIKNFRCFEESTFKGFNSVNLIGGKNNAGKTALLEALFLNFYPSNSTIRLIQNFRGEDDKASRLYPELTWENLFYNQQKEQKISIHSISSDETFSDVTLSCDENIDDFIRYTEDKDKDDEDLLKMKNNLIDAVKSALHLEASKNGSPYASNVMIASSEGQIGSKQGMSDSSVVSFIHSKFNYSSQSLAGDFDFAYEKGFYDRIIKALQTIDKSISEARTSSVGGSVIKMKRENEKSMSLSYYGDAMNKVMSIILKSLKGKENSVLLIDEIENGIHYTAHKEFWKMLFELASEFKIQIFATSHSFEMIKAFNEVASETEFENMATYFEMARHAKTNNIIVNPMDMDMLNYEIKSHSSFRGE